MKVSSLLSGKEAGVITISPDETLHAASTLLTTHNIGAVVAVDAEGLPVGILSERDIIHAIAAHGTAALEQPVSTVMTTQLIIAVPDDELAYLSSTMTAKRIRHLPVMQGDNLIGMVSIGDLVKAQRDHFEGEARAYERYITGGLA
jgi:CBS domain-containing protein